MTWCSAPIDVERQQLAQGVLVGDVRGPTVRRGHGRVKGVVSIGGDWPRLRVAGASRGRRVRLVWRRPGLHVDVGRRSRRRNRRHYPGTARHLSLKRLRTTPHRLAAGGTRTPRRRGLARFLTPTAGPTAQYRLRHGGARTGPSGAPISTSSINDLPALDRRTTWRHEVWETGVTGTKRVRAGGPSGDAKALIYPREATASMFPRAYAQVLVTLSSTSTRPTTRWCSRSTRRRRSRPSTGPIRCCPCGPGRSSVGRTTTSDAGPHRPPLRDRRRGHVIEMIR